jgi:hypothetical protein
MPRKGEGESESHSQREAQSGWKSCKGTAGKFKLGHRNGTFLEGDGWRSEQTALHVMDWARETDALNVKRSIEHAARTGTEAFHWL